MPRTEKDDGVEFCSRGNRHKLGRFLIDREEHAQTKEKLNVSIHSGVLPRAKRRGDAEVLSPGAGPSRRCQGVTNYYQTTPSSALPVSQWPPPKSSLPVSDAGMASTPRSFWNFITRLSCSWLRLCLRTLRQPSAGFSVDLAP